MKKNYLDCCMEQWGKYRRYADKINGLRYKSPLGQMMKSSECRENIDESLCEEIDQAVRQMKSCGRCFEAKSLKYYYINSDSIQIISIRLSMGQTKVSKLIESGKAYVDCFLNMKMAA